MLSLSTVKFSRLVHFKKEFTSMTLTFLGILIVLRDAQPANAPERILITLVGIVIVERALHSKNADSLIVSS